MSRSLCVLLILLAGVVVGVMPAAAQIVEPSPYRVSWELKFDYSRPTRIVVELPKAGAQAYWYLPVTVTNTTGQERMFLPVFELVTEDGRIIRSEGKIPDAVISAIRKREGDRFIQSTLAAAGELRLGDEEARHTVAVWAEPSLEMGHFTILVGGLSGEFQRAKDAQGNETILRKTLQLNFVVIGDEVYPGEDEVNENASLWIMR